MSTIKPLDPAMLADIRAFLEADIIGFATNEPDCAFLIEHLNCWPALAKAEALERARAFVKSCSTVELIAIASGQLDLAKVAQGQAAAEPDRKEDTPQIHTPGQGLHESLAVEKKIEHMKDYLRGYAREDHHALSTFIGREDWRGAAQALLDSRSAHFLEILDNDTLVLISKGSISVNEVAAQVAMELGRKTQNAQEAL